VAVVTTDYHTRRARAIFRREVPQNLAELHFVAVATDGFDADNWWRFHKALLLTSTSFSSSRRIAGDNW